MFCVMKKVKIKSDYDKSAETYDSRYREIQYLKYQGMLENIELKGKVLDLGCGTGILGEFLNERLVGIDISLEMLKQGEDREKFIQGDMENIPFKENSFDTVLSFSAFMNLSDLNKGLREVKRVLKRGGLFLVTLLEKKFTDQFLNDLNNLFEVQEIKKVDEDVGFVCINGLVSD